MKYLYSGTSAIGVPKMAKERTGVAQPGTRWLRAWMVGAEAQAVPMTNLSALMTFRLGPERSYGVRCRRDLGRSYDEECWDWSRFDGYFGTRMSSRVVTNAITCEWGNASLNSYKFAVRSPVVLEWRELRRTIALRGTRSREARGMR